MTDELTQGTTATPAPDTAPDNKSGKSGGDEQNPAWLPDRLKEAKRSAVSKVIKDLGFEKPEDLNAFVTAAREAEKGKLSELDRTRAELAQIKQAQAEAQAQLESERTARRTDKINNSILSAASTAKAEIPQDVLNLLKAENKLDPATLLDDEGNVKTDTVKALIDAAKGLRPNWFGRAGVGSPSNAGGQPPEPDASVKDRARTEQARNLRNKF
jgi:hypothetical protein